MSSPQHVAQNTNPPASTATINHYENFPVASWLCPVPLRGPIAAVYHFARTADDLADEGTASASERLQTLADYRQQLQSVSRVRAGNANDNDNDTNTHTQAGVAVPDARWAPVFAGIARAIRSHALPTDLLHDLLDAFVQDVEKTRDQLGYADEAELRDYCRRSANPIGRLLLHLYAVHDSTSLQQSDAICTALQLINFWQDPSVDIPRGRHYFTQAAQAAHGVDPADLMALRQTPAITRMIAHCAKEARALMLQGAPLVHAVPGRGGWELRLVVQGGLRILDKIESLGYATLQSRPTLHRGDLVVMAWRALWM